ncbi:MAG TPA: PA2169 family four-helix-bundle protein [Luteolibacter sp.]
MPSILAEPSSDPPADSTEQRTHRLLGDLIRVCRDSEETFRLASERDEFAWLKADLLRRSVQRAGFAAALQTLLLHHGVASPVYGGSLTGALHRKWVEWRDTFKAPSTDAMLEELIQSETATLRAYRDTMEVYPVGLYPQDAAVIAFHAREIERTLNELQSLAYGLAR